MERTPQPVYTNSKSLHGSLGWMELASPLFILGAAHSGKSEIAQETLYGDQEAIVLGTADPHADELSARISTLQKARPSLWRTIPVMEQLPDQLSMAIQTSNQILLDSINQYVATVLVHRLQSYSIDQVAKQLELEFQQIMLLISSLPSTKRLVLVSSEISAGLAPPRPAARFFRQFCGQLHHQIARACPSVVHITAGIPTVIKSISTD